VYVVRKWPLRRRSFMCWNITKYAKDLPTDKTIRALYKQFTEHGCLCEQKSSGRPLTAENDERIRASFLHTPKKSTATAATGLSMSKTTVWRVLRKRLVFNPYHHGEHYETPCIRTQCVPRSKHSPLRLHKTYLLMFYKVIVHTGHLKAM
jgi:hypothetical protein